jgi:anhydro-N-acetylmuramic acid kinase
MSGSSLDGVDLASVLFEMNDDHEIIQWNMLAAKTIPYDEGMMERLKTATSISGKELWLLHVDLGHTLGHMIHHFIQDHNLNPDYIASHGHTIFHEPDMHMTCQIGDGSAMSAITGIPVIADFRSNNMALGGQGAPLAPLVDKMLFKEYDLFLNLGGIANLSCTKSGTEIAYDICACNQFFNHFAQKLGQPYDKGGLFARNGAIINDLADYLNQWAYYKKPIPKSLDNTEVKNLILDIDRLFNHTPEDILRTGVYHVSEKIALAFNEIHIDTSREILATGGGAYHAFLIEEIQSKLKDDLIVHIPSRSFIEFKEAILMALAGNRRWYGQAIFDAELTHASRSCTGGAVYWPL